MVDNGWTQMAEEHKRMKAALKKIRGIEKKMWDENEELPFLSAAACMAQTANAVLDTLSTGNPWSCCTIPRTNEAEIEEAFRRG